MIAAMGIEVIEVESICEYKQMYGAYRKAYELAQQGKPSLIYPTGKQQTLKDFGEQYGIAADVAKFRVVDDGTAAPRALVDGEDVFFAHCHCPSWMR